LGVRLQGRRERDSELRAIVDDGVAVLDRAEQFRRDAVIYVDHDGANTSKEGLEAFRGLQAELAEASQLQGQIAIRVEPGSPLLAHYAAAIEALRSVSQLLGVPVVLWQPNADQALLEDLMKLMERARVTANSERADFVAAAQKRWG
jgi:hypothetical protein